MLIRRNLLWLGIAQALLHGGIPEDSVSVNDSDGSGGGCTLPHAVIAANTDADSGGCLAGPGTNRILFQGVALITVDESIPPIVDELTISGGGQEITVDFNGFGGFQIENVSELATAVTIEFLTLRNGQSSQGGAIRNAGETTLDNVVIEDNRSPLGGGIFNSGTMTITDSIISDNGPVPPESSTGGGIVNDGGELRLQSSLLADNTASVAGGVFNDGGSLLVFGSAISGNVSTYSGGGVYNDAAAGTAVIANTTLEGNTAVGGNGGGVHNFGGTVIISDDSQIENNFAGQNGGGVFSEGGMLLLTDSTVTGNSSGEQGGGVGLIGRPSGTFQCNGCTLSNNTADEGGGLFSRSGSIALSQCTLDGNTAVDGPGGGVRGTVGTLSLSNCTVSGNSASTSGGGISNDESSLDVVFSSVYDNTAELAGGGIDHLGYASAPGRVLGSAISNNVAGSDGGGVVNGRSNLVIDGTTIDGNTAASGGGFRQESYGTVSIQNSTLSHNVGESGSGVVNTGEMHLDNVTIVVNAAPPDPPNPEGVGPALVSTDTLVIRNSVIALSEGTPDCELTGDLTVVSSFFGDESCDGTASGDPMIEPLMDNGGVGMTHEPVMGSPLIDAGDPATCTRFDQRGLRRDESCDIGAVEFGEIQIFESSFENDELIP